MGSSRFKSQYGQKKRKRENKCIYLSKKVYLCVYEFFFIRNKTCVYEFPD